MTCNVGGYRSTVSIFLVCHGLTTIPRLCDDEIGQVNKFDDFFLVNVDICTNFNGYFYQIIILRTFITQ